MSFCSSFNQYFFRFINSRRLKEQEKLINSVADSNDANNFSMIGPLFVERDQVRAEIEELTRSLKAEKKRIYELMRKHGISPSKS